MSNIKFVVHSEYDGRDRTGGPEDAYRPKRAKHACLGCQSRKIRCSGTQPCKLCQSRNIECVFANPSTSKRQRREAPATTNGAANGATNGANGRTGPIPHESNGSNGAPPSAAPAVATGISDSRHATGGNGSNMPIISPPNVSSAFPLDTKFGPTQNEFMAQRRKSLGSASRSSKLRFNTTRQPYFRWLGPTAIAPPKQGTYRLLSVNLRSEGNGDTSTGDNGDARQSVLIERQASATADTGGNTNVGDGGEVPLGAPMGVASDAKELDDYDQHLPLPSTSQYREFFDHVANYLPYLPLEVFEDRLARGLISECLLYAMASVAERLTNKPAESGSTPPYSVADRYIETAKRLVLPHLASPSAEIVYALLLIAYSEFGEDRDSGLWAWSGMAIRMCYDLGLHKRANRSDDPDDRYGRNVFWAVVCLDRLISCGTGRKSSVPDADIEYKCEFSTITGPNGEPRTNPFPYMCRLLLMLGRVSNYINTFSDAPEKMPRLSSRSSVSPSSLSPESWDIMETLSQFQHELSEFYTTLPPDLLFDVQNFQQFSKIKYSQVFLQLHIWNQALVLAVHHPTIAYPECKLDITGLLTNPHADLTGTGSISIADMVSFADLIDADSFLANPFLSQPIYMAACASLTLWHTLPSTAQSHSLYTLQRTYSTCRQILQRMQAVWRGISWHSRTLDSLAASEPDVDLSVDAKGTVITKDLGVVRKASIDETTRRWLAAEIGDGNADDIYGLFISGLTGDQGLMESVSPEHHHARSSSEEFKLPPRPPLTHSTSAGEDTFRNIVLRNMDLEDYLRPVFS